MTNAPQASQMVDESHRDWTAFTSLDNMSNHWDRAAWWPGRQGYYWYLTFDEDTELRSVAERCQNAIQAPYFDLVPLSHLHLTISRIGFDDELDQDELDAVAVAAGNACQFIGSFDMTIGPLAGSSGAISFSVSPLAPLLKAKEILDEVSAQVLSNPQPVKTNFRPHVGIAYCNTTVPMAKVAPIIRPLRNLPRVQTRITGANLVRLIRGEQSYRWLSLGWFQF